ncbi:MAG: transcription elongation factor GreA [Clostridiales bacterium]|jgi:transcription elongation factor GreA|nr:transcription elongation factor GreA [Clostridiales bacterium]MDR2751594.1 transcription elongation factor GreA [Clostridiales bacterium]
MSEKKTFLSYEGIKALENELHELRTVRRQEVAGKIKEARAQGDLSENAEYDAAKEEQAEIEARIAEIENKLSNVELIDEDNLKTDTVSVGSIVKVFDMEMDEEMVFTITGSVESDPLDGKISNESPLGQALLQKKVGDVVDVVAPDGLMSFKVLQISIPTK